MKEVKSRSVILAAGGFYLNDAMVVAFAPAYACLLPLGNIGKTLTPN